jgi:hypothetical protein
MINQVTLFLLILVFNLFFSCEFVLLKGEFRGNFSDNKWWKI